VEDEGGDRHAAQPGPTQCLFLSQPQMLTKEGILARQQTSLWRSYVVGPQGRITQEGVFGRARCVGGSQLTNSVVLLPLVTSGACHSHKALRCYSC
jgi:hypothetical protein